jgi:ribonuclease HI
MKTIRSLILCLGVMLLTASLLEGQELSKYRGFSLDTSLATVLKLSDQKLADVKTIHVQPMLIQELAWWPPSSPGASSRPDSVEQINFSFCNGTLYKISVTYDHTSTQGLTAGDMVKSISAKYGPATNVESEIDPVLNAQFDMKQKSVASWQDSQYSVNLVRSSYTDRFGLALWSKRANAEAEAAIVEAVKLEEQERPEKEANQRKKEADDLEAQRLKNQVTFHP